MQSLTPTEIHIYIVWFFYSLILSPTHYPATRIIYMSKSRPRKKIFKANASSAAPGRDVYVAGLADASANARLCRSYTHIHECVQSSIVYTHTYIDLYIIVYVTDMTLFPRPGCNNDAMMMLRIVSHPQCACVMHYRQASRCTAPGGIARKTGRPEDATSRHRSLLLLSMPVLYFDSHCRRAASWRYSVIGISRRLTVYIGYYLLYCVRYWRSIGFKGTN